MNFLLCFSYEIRFQWLCKCLTYCYFMWLGKGRKKSTSGAPGFDSLMICMVQLAPLDVSECQLFIIYDVSRWPTRSERPQMPLHLIEPPRTSRYEYIKLIVQR